MADMGTKEASEKWGYSQATISKWCREGLIPNATQDKPNSPWHIPKDSQCPRKIKGA
ncbi:MAG: helix-turn-helix domain-containing protein [Clostridiales bacterium]|nr:helix-turn-helix domain-containing protein [Clostridiales bacterium]MBO5924894.1 helix-turn-helix domain-containing protein [Clostridia bacterium]